MATLKLIGKNGHRMMPCGSGWTVGGIYFPTWAEAYNELMHLEPVDEGAAALHADECVDHAIERMEAQNHRYED